MYKGIKIIITIFIAFSGLLNAMEERENGSSVLSWRGDNRMSISDVGGDQTTLYSLLEEEEPAGVGVRHSKKGLKNGLTTEFDTTGDDDQCEPNNLTNTKSSKGRSSGGLLLYLLTRPPIWGMKLVDKLTEDLDEKPVAQLLFSCSVQTAAEIINTNPTVPLSLLKSGFSKCGNVTSSLSDLLTLKSMLMTGAALWLNKDTIMNVMLAAGNMYATWRVGNKVDEVKEQIDEVKVQIQELDEREDARHKETQSEVAETRQELINKLGQYKSELTQIIQESGDKVEKELQNQADELMKIMSALEQGLNGRFDHLEQGVKNIQSDVIAVKKGQEKTNTILDKMKEEIKQFAQEFKKSAEESKEASKELQDAQKHMVVKLEEEIKNLKSMNEEEIVRLWSRLQEQFIDSITKKIEGITEDVIKTLRASDADALIKFKEAIEQQIDRRFAEFRSEVKKDQEDHMNQLRNELKSKEEEHGRKDEAYKLQMTSLLKEIEELKKANEETRRENREVKNLVTKVLRNQGGQAEDLTAMRIAMEAVARAAQGNQRALPGSSTSGSRISRLEDKDYSEDSGDSTEEEKEEG